MADADIWAWAPIAVRCVSPTGLFELSGGMVKPVEVEGGFSRPCRTLRIRWRMVGQMLWPRAGAGNRWDRQRQSV